MQLKIISENLVKICKVTGLKVKKGIFKVAVDGATIKKTGHDQYAVIVDAGMGGTYPSEECRK